MHTAVLGVPLVDKFSQLLGKGILIILFSHAEDTGGGYDDIVLTTENQAQNYLELRSILFQIESGRVFAQHTGEKEDTTSFQRGRKKPPKINKRESLNDSIILRSSNRQVRKAFKILAKNEF